MMMFQGDFVNRYLNEELSTSDDLRFLNSQSKKELSDLREFLINKEVDILARMITNIDYKATDSKKFEMLLALEKKVDKKLEEFGEREKALPDVLNTDKANRLIEKAVNAGYITVEAGQYKWTESKTLLAYFAMKASKYLCLNTNNGRIIWKPFEVLFGEKNLRNIKADNEKYYTEFNPNGSIKIDTLFEEEAEE